MYCYFAVISALFWTTPTVFSNATLTRNLTEWRNIARRPLVTIAMQRRAVDPSIAWLIDWSIENRSSSVTGTIRVKVTFFKTVLFTRELYRREQDADSRQGGVLGATRRHSRWYVDLLTPFAMLSTVFEKGNNPIKGSEETTRYLVRKQLDMLTWKQCFQTVRECVQT